MKIEEGIKMLNAQLDCIEKSIAGSCDEVCEECTLNYDQGNMGEHKEYLRMSIKALKTIQKVKKIIDDECFRHQIVEKDALLQELINFPLCDAAEEMADLNNTLYKVVEALQEVEDGSRED